LAEVNKYADSLGTNLHKWGLVGFDCSLFFVRDRKNLTEAMDVTPAFLRSKEGDAGLVIDYRNWGISLGRRFRSLKVWFVLRSYGVEGFQKHLNAGIGHAHRLAAIIRASSTFELVTTPRLSLVVLRLRPKDSEMDDEEFNLLNQRLHARLTLRPDVFLTQTVLHGIEREVYCIRFAMGGPNTSWGDVETVWGVVELEGSEVLREWGRKS